jgi:mannose-6-phosphate isomerase-like protein (cupin superfamily)
MPPAPISRDNAPHYIWGDNCDGWHLLQESNLSVIEERMPPGASEVRHFHTNAQQFFFILSGQAVMETNSERILLLAGQGCYSAAYASPISESFRRTCPLSGDLAAVKLRRPGHRVVEKESPRRTLRRGAPYTRR